MHVVYLGKPFDAHVFGSKFVHEVDVLVKNDGCMIHECVQDESGLEKNFATNTLGPYLQTHALIQNLETRKGRVVIVSSDDMLTQPLTTDFNSEKMRDFDGTAVYALNKRQQVLARRNSGIFFVSMYPGCRLS